MFLRQHRDEELAKFQNHLNECHHSIQFTFELAQSQVPFLETTLNINDEGDIWTDIYYKSTGSQIYLHFSSAHPYHIKKSLPYSQLLRLRHIWSKDADFLKHSGVILYHLYKQGYPLEILYNCL